MIAVKAGDVIRYRQGEMLKPMIGVVLRQVSERTTELYDGTWIDAAAVLAVIRNVKDMPSPSSMAAASRKGIIPD